MLSCLRKKKTICETVNNGYKAVIMYEHKLTVENTVLSMNLAKKQANISPES